MSEPTANSNVPTVSVLPPANGSMRDRVQALCLPARVDNGKGRGLGGWLPWILCILLAGTAVTLGAKAFKPRPDAAGVGERKPADDKKVAEGEEVVLESKGYIIPAHQIQVSPIDVSGRIIKLADGFEEGAHFAKDTPLAWLDPTSYDQDMREAEQARTGAQESLAAARQTYQSLVRGLEEDIPISRTKLAAAIAKRDGLKSEMDSYIAQGAVGTAENEIIKRRTDYEAQKSVVDQLSKELKNLEAPDGSRQAMIAQARAQVERAQAEVAQAEARRMKAKWRLDNCVIRAPVAGTILTKKAEIGNLISPLSFNVAASLCEMADLSDLEVDLGIQERDVAKVFPGQKCKVRCDAYPDHTYEGVLSRLMPIANRAKAEVPVRVKVTVPSSERSGEFLKPEMSAVVSFIGGKKK